MKPVFLYSLLFVLFVGAGGCVYHELKSRVPMPFPSDERPTNYVLILGDGTYRVKCLHPDKFAKAIQDLEAADGKMWNTQVLINDDSGVALSSLAAKYPNPALGVGAPFVSHVTLARGNYSGSINGGGTIDPCTNHVTQKVGMNTISELKAALALLNPDITQ